MMTDKEIYIRLYDEYLRSQKALVDLYSLTLHDTDTSNKYHSCRLVTDIMLNPSIDAFCELFHSPQGSEFIHFTSRHPEEIPPFPSYETLRECVRTFGQGFLQFRNIFIDSGYVSYPPKEHSIYCGSTIVRCKCLEPTLYDSTCLYGATFECVARHPQAIIRVNGEII